MHEFWSTSLATIRLNFTSNGASIPDNLAVFKGLPNTPPAWQGKELLYESSSII